MRFTFTHSHAFPGGIVVVAPGAGGVATFEDGSVVDAEWWEEGKDLILDLPAYRTAKGTDIAAHRWRLIPSADGTWRSYRERGGTSSPE